MVLDGHVAQGVEGGIELAHGFDDHAVLAQRLDELVEILEILLDLVGLRGALGGELAQDALEQDIAGENPTEQSNHRDRAETGDKKHDLKARANAEFAGVDHLFAEKAFGRVTLFKSGFFPREKSYGFEWVQTCRLREEGGNGRPGRLRRWCGNLIDEKPHLVPARSRRPCPSLTGAAAPTFWCECLLEVFPETSEVADRIEDHPAAVDLLEDGGVGADDCGCPASIAGSRYRGTGRNTAQRFCFIVRAIRGIRRRRSCFRKSPAAAAFCSAGGKGLENRCLWFCRGSPG